MRNQPTATTRSLNTIAIVALTALWSCPIWAQSHPQEVLDLIAGHEALAAKVRPLIDRIELPKESDGTGFRPEGAPVRATVTTSTSNSTSNPEQRVPERLRQRDRAVSNDGDNDRLATRLAALDAEARAERERVMRPEFGVDLNRNETESGGVRFGDNIRGTRPPPGSGGDTGSPNTMRVDARAIATARSRLAALERELASLEAAINASER